MVVELVGPGKPVDEIMMKRPEDLTEGEARRIMIARMNATTHDERERVNNMNCVSDPSLTGFS